MWQQHHSNQAQSFTSLKTDLVEDINIYSIAYSRCFHIEVIPSFRNGSIKALAKWRNPVHVFLTEICYQWSKWLGSQIETIHRSFMYNKSRVGFYPKIKLIGVCAVSVCNVHSRIYGLCVKRRQLSPENRIYLLL